MTNINKLNMGLDFDINVPAFMSDLRALNGIAAAEFDSHVKVYEKHMQDIMQRRLAVEAKFATAEEIRMRKMVDLMKLHQELNLSQRAYQGILQQINAEYTKSVIAKIRITQETIAARNAEKETLALLKLQSSAAKTISEIRAQQKRDEITKAFTARSASDSLAEKQLKTEQTIGEIRRSHERDTVTNIMRIRAEAQERSDRELLAAATIAEIRKQKEREKITKAFEDKATKDALAASIARTDLIIDEIRRRQESNNVTKIMEERAKEQEKADKEAEAQVTITEIRKQKKREEITKAYQDKAERDALAAKKAQSDLVVDEIRRREESNRVTREFEQRNADAAVAARTEASKKVIQQIKTQQRAAIQAAREEEQVRRQVIAITRRYETVEESANRERAVVAQAFRMGAISAQEYRDALAAINAQAEQTQSGLGRTRYAISAVAMGVEDFVTVASMQNFTMDAMAMGARAASNNVSQAFHSMAGGAGGFYGAIASIGVLMASVAIPAIYRWAMGIEDAETSAKKLEDRIKSLTSSFTYLNDVQDRQRELASEQKDISEIDDLDEANRRLEKLFSDREQMLADQDRATNELKAQSEALWEAIVPQSAMDDLDVLLNNIQKNLGGAYKSTVKEELQDIRDDFNHNITTIGAPAALAQLEHNLDRFGKALNILKEQAGGLEGIDVSPDLFSGNAFLPGFGGIAHNFGRLPAEMIDDAEVIDNIQALLDDETKLAEAAAAVNKSTEEYGQALRDAQDTLQLIADTEKRIAEIKDEEAEKKNQEIFDRMTEREEEFAKLTEQTKGNSLRGADKEIFNLGVKQRDLLESQLGTYDELNALFNMELESIAKDIEEQLANVAQVNVPGQNSLASEVQSITSANRMIVDKLLAPPKDDKQEQQIKLLEAIRKHLSGNKMLMEVIK